MSVEHPAITFQALMSPRLCDLLRSIDKGPKRLRRCQTCRQNLPQPYRCPIDAFRDTPSPTPQGQGETRS